MKSRIIAVAAALMAAPAVTLATPIYQSFGPFDATFGGTGIPNDAVAAHSVFVDGVNQITMALTAHQRYHNPALTNNGAGEFYADPGSNCGIATDPVNCPSTSQGSLWNIGFYIEVDGPSATLSDYDFELYYDFNPGADTPIGGLGKVNVNNFLSSAGQDPATMTLTQGSENLMFNYLMACIPGVIEAPGCPAPAGFDPDALGEYSFYLTATTKTAFPASIGTVGIDVQVVPLPAAVWFFGSALGLMGFMRRRMRAG